MTVRLPVNNPVIIKYFFGRTASLHAQRHCRISAAIGNHWILRLGLPSNTRTEYWPLDCELVHDFVGQQ